MSRVMNKMRRLSRQPKVQIAAILVLLAAVALLRQPVPGDKAAVHLLTAVLAALLAEAAFFGHVGEAALQSAVVTGMLTGALLAPGTDLVLVWLAAVAAIASKKLLESVPGKHIFNPAAFGLLLSVVLFGNRINWWGFSSPYLVVVGAGLVLLRLKRLSLPFAYLLARGIGAVLFGDADPGFQFLLSGNIFFAFIMLVEPKTSPAKRPAQWLFGALVGILATAAYRLMPSLEGDLAALLAANLVRPGVERLGHGIERIMSKGKQE